MDNRRHFYRQKIMNRENREELTWETHPAREQPRRALGAFIIIICFCAVVLIFFSSVTWSVFSGVVLLVSLSRFFLPTHYTLSSTHVKWTFLGMRQSRPWSMFKRAVKTRGGVFLSPFEKPNRLEGFRGVHLLCRKNRSEVFDFARGHIRKETPETS